jgi:cytochrome b
VFKVLVWDLPTRCFHWVLAVCVLLLVVTGEWGGSAMVWHYRLGTLVLTLLAFRLVWGFCGGFWSRFASFVVTPAQLFSLLKLRRTSPLLPLHSIGHNPLGAYAVLFMLLLLLLQASTGLFSDDGILARGPLASLLPQMWVAAATYLHTTLVKSLLLTLIALHIAAIIWHRIVRRDNLLGPMVYGYKWLDQPAPSSQDSMRTRVYALLVVIVAGLILSWLILRN